MKNKAHDLAIYAFKKEEPLLLDTRCRGFDRHP